MQEMKRQPASAMTLSYHRAKFCALDLDEDMVEKVGRRHPTPEEAPFQRQEIAGQLRQRLRTQHDPAEHENRWDLRILSRDGLDVTSVVDVRNLHVASENDYGHTWWP